MTEVGVSDYGTLELLRAESWRAITFGRYERCFGLLEYPDKPVHVPGAAVAIPARLRWELRATLSPWERTKGGTMVWQVEISFRMQSTTKPTAYSEGMPVNREAPLWLRRGADTYELVSLGSGEMRRLEGALQLGWRP